MSAGWTSAFAVLASVHQDEFEEVCAEAIDVGDAVIIRRDVLRLRVRDPAQEVALLLALPGDLGQRCRYAPGRYVFPLWEAPVVQDAVSLLGIRAGVVPTAVFDMELLGGALDALRAGLLRRAPTFGPSYPRIEIG
jgi:hypothetical protein